MTNKSSTITTKSSSTNRTTRSTRKARVTHARVQKVKVTTLGKASNTSEKQPHRACIRCKESSNNVKLLSARVGRIEQLVHELAKTTENFSKRKESYSSQSTTWKFGSHDLKTCSLEELQNLVISTTNMMMIPQKPTITNQFCSEPTEISQTSIIAPVKTVTLKLDNNALKLDNNNALRKDSGFAESKSSDIHHNNIAN